MAQMSSYHTVDEALVGDKRKAYVEGSKILASGPDADGRMVNLNIPISELRGESKADWEAEEGEPGFIANKPELSRVASTGSFNDLTDVPEIPAAQVQSDWNQENASEPDFIKHKPAIPAEQVQSDWNQTNVLAKDFINNKPTNVSNFINDAGYLTQHQDISGKADKSDMAIVEVLSKPDRKRIILKEGLEETVLIAHQDISEKADKSDLRIDAGSTGDKKKVVLGTGKEQEFLISHQDISGKQDAISDLSTIRSGAAAGATAYQKDVNGIPKADLTTAVQASLDKADTALQTHQDLSDYALKSELPEVPVKGVKVNGSSAVDAQGVANIDISGKQDTINDLSTIRSGAEAGATAVQPATLADYALKSDIAVKDVTVDGSSVVNAQGIAAIDLTGKQDTISDLSTIRSGAEAGATAVQPATLESYALKSELPSSDQLVPEVAADHSDAGKVLTVKTVSGGAEPDEIVWGDAGTIPPVGYSEDGYVLTAGSNKDYSWQPAQGGGGGGSSYTIAEVHGPYSLDQYNNVIIPLPSNKKIFVIKDIPTDGSDLKLVTPTLPAGEILDLYVDLTIPETDETSHYYFAEDANGNNINRIADCGDNSSYSSVDSGGYAFMHFFYKYFDSKCLTTE